MPTCPVLRLLACDNFPAIAPLEEKGHIDHGGPDSLGLDANYPPTNRWLEAPRGGGGVLGEAMGVCVWEGLLVGGVLDGAFWGGVGVHAPKAKR